MEKLKKLVAVLDATHVADIVVIDMRQSSPLYDFMVVTTARNERIIAAVLRELKDLGAEDEFTLKFIEGHTGGEWVLADFGDIIVHVFSEEMRTRYHLEKLWGDAQQIALSELL